jgi:uncharacterized membrane protein
MDRRKPDAAALQTPLHKHFSETKGAQRLAYGTLVGLVVGFGAGFLPGALTWQTRALVGWCSGAVVYLVLAWWLAHVFDAARTRRRAQAQDQPSVLLFLLMLVAVLASVAGIAVLLQQIKGQGSVDGRALRIALAMFALFCSWMLIHAIFAFRYAHRYYQEEALGEPNGPGLEFPGKLDPDYFDFMYYSYVVGMTSQVSDVQATSREMRRLTLVHSMLSFAFNMLVVALSINVVASLLG